MIDFDPSEAGGGRSLIWPIWRCAAERGMVFDLSVLNRVYNFVQVSPKQGMYFRILVLNRVRVSNNQRLTYMYTQILVQYPPGISTACKLIFVRNFGGYIYG